MRDAIQSFRAAILDTLGHAPVVIEPGRFQRFPTRGRRSDQSGWCKLFDDLRGGVFGCYRQGISESWFAEDRAQLPPSQRAELARQIAAATAEREAKQRAEWAQNAARIERLLGESVPLVPGDPVTLYLKRRGLAGVWPLPTCLRLHRALTFWHDGERLGEFPVMVAPLVAPDGRTVALHRTYLTADGRKAEVPSPKKLTCAAGSLAGACIPLNKPQRHRLGIAEGVETALAAWCGSGVPTVAAYSAGNLAQWRWPAGLQSLIVFADADPVGREAADTLRARAIRADLHCEVVAPSIDGADWCDVWVQGRMPALAEQGGAA
mgnify:CR=1 FL=1